MSASTDEMQPEKVERLDAAFTSFLARILCLKPVLYLETGTIRAPVDSDPPTPDHRVSTCQSCSGPMRGSDSGRVLCKACRANPRLFESAPLIETMYWSSHPKYALDQETKTVIALIGRQRHIATQSRVVTRELINRSYHAYETCKRRQQGERNVYFTPKNVAGCSYARSITQCNPRYTESSDGQYRINPARGCQQHPAITVGGLGLKLFDVVKESAFTWLDNLDAMIRAHFGISLERRPDENMSVTSVMQNFATLIAKRVVLLEEQSDDPTQTLCTRGFERISKIQYVTCEDDAERQRQFDVRAMCDLAKLARGQPAPFYKQPLIDFLVAPCPELLKELPSVAANMRFMELCAALEGRATEMEEALTRWRASVQTESLCLLLEGAIESVQNWRRSFLTCLRRDDAQGRKRPLPAQGWVDSEQIARWSLVSDTAHKQRRTGLDPTGLRIVLMCSALTQLNGDGHFFVPGVMCCKMMHKVCTVQESYATYAYKALNDQLFPYMTGEPWRTACAKLANWKGSHMEEDVREAAVALGEFSLDEIFARYGHRTDDDHAHLRGSLVSMTIDKMIFKPADHYEQWFPVAVNMLLPILTQLRQSAGIACGVVPSTLGEVLRLLKPVRDWQPLDGPLKITAGEAYVPQVKSALLRLKGEGSPLVKYSRPKKSTVMCWVFDPVLLARVLNK